MAILQSRMIALINAAIDYQHALETLIRMIHNESRNMLQGNQTAEGAMQNLALQANDMILLEDASLSQHTISTEHYHFKRHANRNKIEREYQLKRRGGVTTREHFEPHYATTEFSSLAHRTTAFRGTGQNQRGNIPRQQPITYIPNELTPKQKAEIDKEIERFDPNANVIPKGKDPFEPSGGQDDNE